MVLYHLQLVQVELEELLVVVLQDAMLVDEADEGPRAGERATS